MTTPATDTNFDAAAAEMLTLAARNGVEDLHMAGVFSDQQAPSLHRRIRTQIYELLIATRCGHLSRGNNPFLQYVDNLAENQKGGRGVAALQGAVARAVDDFAAAEALDPATATKLRNAAINGAVNAYKTITRLNLGRSKDEEQDRLAVDFWVRSIAPYWEEPGSALSSKSCSTSVNHEARRGRTSAGPLPKAAASGQYVSPSGNAYETRRGTRDMRRQRLLNRREAHRLAHRGFHGRVNVLGPHRLISIG